MARLFSKQKPWLPAGTHATTTALSLELVRCLEQVHTPDHPSLQHPAIVKSRPAKLPLTPHRLCCQQQPLLSRHLTAILPLCPPAGSFLLGTTPRGPAW